MKTSEIAVSEEIKVTEREPKTKTILAPINVVDRPSEALDFAIELARRWQAKLYAMYVYSHLPRVSGAKLIQAIASVDWERHRVSVNLFRLVDRVRHRYQKTFACFVDNDCPAEAIQNVASRVEADLIIISAHDKKWLAKLLLYSDGDDIARRSTVPVLVYRPKFKAE
ncbi:MAG TPA: universal stress protein [Chthoniobacterales bacterium]|nr:universal stress protein [Chthoniobacterales bacterium]